MIEIAILAITTFGLIGFLMVDNVKKEAEIRELQIAYVDALTELEFTRLGVSAK
jgi:hypothetical protein